MKYPYVRFHLLTLEAALSISDVGFFFKKKKEFFFDNGIIKTKTVITAKS